MNQDVNEEKPKRIEVRTYQMQAISAEDFADALVRGGPDQFARVWRAVFDRLNHHTNTVSLIDLTQECPQYGLPDYFNKFMRAVSWHAENESRSKK